MKFFYQLFLNVFFFILYSVIAFKAMEKTSYAELVKNTESLPWNTFFFVMAVFIFIAFLSIATTYAVLAKRKVDEMKKGVALDDKDVEVTPDFEIDGKEESPENLMDIVSDKTGKIFKEPAKSMKKKNENKNKVVEKSAKFTLSRQPNLISSQGF